MSCNCGTRVVAAVFFFAMVVVGAFVGVGVAIVVVVVVEIVVVVAFGIVVSWADGVLLHADRIARAIPSVRQE